jgi:hypothetical protein
MAYELIAPDMMLRASCMLLGIWGVLSALQSFADARAWQTGRALGWDLQRLRSSRFYAAPIMARLYAPGMMQLLAFLKLAMAAVLIFTPNSMAIPFVLAALWAVSALLALRGGGDGADKMALVVAAGAFLQSLGAEMDLPLLSTAGWLWAGGQLTIAYATSGISKLVLAPWRNGCAPREALSSFLYGHRFAHAALRNRAMASTLAWTIILTETLFPLALFAPLPILAGALAFFLLLHFAIAVIIGLNTYPWAFLAAYPSVLLLARSIHNFF